MLSVWHGDEDNDDYSLECRRLYTSVNEKYSAETQKKLIIYYLETSTALKKAKQDRKSNHGMDWIAESLWFCPTKLDYKLSKI